MIVLHLWLAAYLLALGAIGWGLHPWYRRRWFKIVCLPGTLLAAFLQMVVAPLCVHPVKKVHGFKDGSPFVELGLSRFPALGSALFVALTQTALFALFLLTCSALEAGGWFTGRGVTLPDVGPDVPPEILPLALRDYLRATLDWSSHPAQTPWVTFAVLYLFGSTCAALRLCRRQWKSAILGLFALWGIVSVCCWFGVGVRTFSRGWWAEWFYVPEWWERFSLFLTIGFAVLAGATMVRAARFSGRHLAHALAHATESRRSQPG